ncbi:MAG: hypothetical protein R3F59_26940 [Myxococcota bacterium]
MLLQWGLALLAGCGTSETQILEHGGEMSLQLAPLSGAGVTVDVTLPGLSQQAVDSVDKRDAAGVFPCDAAYMSYATNTQTGRRMYAVLDMCAAQVEIGGRCPGPVSFSFDLAGEEGRLFLSMDPLGESSSAGDQFWIGGELPVDDPLLGTEGALEGAVTVDDGCMERPLEHQLAVQWRFPLHSEVTTTSPFDWDLQMD